MLESNESSNLLKEAINSVDRYYNIIPKIDGCVIIGKSLIAIGAAIHELTHIMNELLINIQNRKL